MLGVIELTVGAPANICRIFDELLRPPLNITRPNRDLCIPKTDGRLPDFDGRAETIAHVKSPLITHRFKQIDHISFYLLKILELYCLLILFSFLPLCVFSLSIRLLCTYLHCAGRNRDWMIAT